jgi:hypothetical protein
MNRPFLTELVFIGILAYEQDAPPGLLLFMRLLPNFMGLLPIEWAIFFKNHMIANGMG